MVNQLNISKPLNCIIKPSESGGVMSLKQTEIFRFGNPCHGDTTLLNGMGTYFP